MGFYRGFPAPWQLHFSMGVSLIHLVLQNWPFPAENQQPHMEALVSTVAQEVEGGIFIKDVPCCDKESLAPIGGWKKPSLVCMVLPCWLCNEVLHICLWSGWGVSQEKMYQGLTGVKDDREDASGESVSPGTNVEHLLNVYPTGCCLCYRAASVPIPGGHQPPQVLAAGCGLLSSKHISTPLMHAAKKAAFTARPTDIKSTFYGCKDLAGSGASER